MERPRPYYGFSCGHCLCQFSAIADHAKGKTDRRLMLGVHMSSKSLRGFPVKRPKRTLRTEEVVQLYAQIPPPENSKDNLFRVVHFNSDGPDIIDAELLFLSDYIAELGYMSCGVGARLIDGFQLNGALPKPGYLSWFHKMITAPLGTRRRKEIILQLGGYALERAENNPEKLAGIVSAYEGVIDYVLLDASGGKGLPVDPEWARPFLRAVRDRCPRVGLGFAGGLGPDTLNPLMVLAPEFPDLSTDMESKIRDDDDNFVISKALAGLDGLMEIFEKK